MHTYNGKNLFYSYILRDHIDFSITSSLTIHAFINNWKNSLLFTAKKAHSQSFKKVRLELSLSLFNLRHLWIAFSRVWTLQNARVKLIKSSKQQKNRREKYCHLWNSWKLEIICYFVFNVSFVLILCLFFFHCLLSFYVIFFLRFRVKSFVTR